MSNPHKIYLLGFSSFEQSTFESFFRLAARRPPGYLLVNDAALANLTVVNADDPATMRAVMVQKPSAQVMLVGANDGGTGWSLQKRPLNLMKVLANVEQLLNGGAPAAVRSAPASASAHSPLSAQPAVAPVQRAAPVVAPKMAAPTFSSSRAPDITPRVPSGFSPNRTASQVLSRSAPSSPPVLSAGSAAAPGFSTESVPAQLAATGQKHLTAQQRNSIRLGMADFAMSGRNESPVLGAATRPPEMSDSDGMDHIMVVDDSDIALKFMRNRLTRFGFRTDLVSSGEEALGRLNVRPYKFVFLDVMMEGLDGYQTCRAIKQRKYTEGKPPVVVMLTSRGGTIDKIRGTLAGCDAYLTKPLNERDLISILAKHDRGVARGFQETNFGASMKSGFDALR